MGKRTFRSIPTLPPEVQKWPKGKLHGFLLEALGHNLGPIVHSELLPRQLEACAAGVRAFAGVLKQIQKDEFASQYEQVRGDALDDATCVLEDHISVFFVACQIYVTRVVDTVRWLKAQMDNRPGPTYIEADKVRSLGDKVTADMTIADCMWHLGNYAKHSDELESWNKSTIVGLQKLGMCDAEGTIASDAIWRGIQSASGRTAPPSVENVNNDLQNFVEYLLESLHTIERSLGAWADALKDELVADLDEFCGYDRLHTKRLNESVRAAISRALEGKAKGT